QSIVRASHGACGAERAEDRAGPGAAGDVAAVARPAELDHGDDGRDVLRQGGGLPPALSPRAADPPQPHGRLGGPRAAARGKARTTPGPPWPGGWWRPASRSPPPSSG